MYLFTIRFCNSKITFIKFTVLINEAMIYSPSRLALCYSSYLTRQPVQLLLRKRERCVVNHLRKIHCFLLNCITALSGCHCFSCMGKNGVPGQKIVGHKQFGIVCIFQTERASSYGNSSDSDDLHLILFGLCIITWCVVAEKGKYSIYLSYTTAPANNAAGKPNSVLTQKINAGFIG